jgi:small GTP-binding protein
MMLRQRQFKVIFLGDTGVGKTSIINRRVGGGFDFQMTPTLGTHHSLVEVRMSGESIQLFLWDTAGQEQFQALVPYYLRNTHIACLVCALIDDVSVGNLVERWLPLLQALPDRPAVFAIVNKIDLRDGAPQTLEQVTATLEKSFATIKLVSARTEEGITDLFDSLASTALELDVAIASDDPPAAPKRDNCC